jgi:hypothetical protein
MQAHMYLKVALKEGRNAFISVISVVAWKIKCIRGRICVYVLVYKSVCMQSHTGECKCIYIHEYTFTKKSKSKRLCNNKGLHCDLNREGKPDSDLLLYMHVCYVQQWPWLIPVYVCMYVMCNRDSHLFLYMHVCMLCVTVSTTCSCVSMYVCHVWLTAIGRLMSCPFFIFSTAFPSRSRICIRCTRTHTHTNMRRWDKPTLCCDACARG